MNSATNKVYVGMNDAVGTVAIIDRAAGSNTSVATGKGLSDIAVNAVSNKIYAIDKLSNSVTVIDGATNNTQTVPVGSAPIHAAVNSITNKIYVTNSGDNSVTIIDGATNSTSTIGTEGGYPSAISINPATNKIYVANEVGNSVAVIDGATNSVTSVAVGANPVQVALNASTNKVYVANSASSSVTVIDGATNTAQTISVQGNPEELLVNPVSNTVFVTYAGSPLLTKIDGVTNTTFSIPLGSTDRSFSPLLLSMNLVTNQVYVGSVPSGFLLVIDGKTDQVSTLSLFSSIAAFAVNPVTDKIYASTGAGLAVVDASPNRVTTAAVGAAPESIAVNPVTNTIYVANYLSGNVNVVDGVDNTTVSVAVGSNPIALAVNPITNKTYVANEGSSSVSVIDGTDNSTVTVTTASQPWALAINPVTDKIYVVSSGGTDVTVINGEDNSTATVATESSANALALNPVTDKIYLSNPLSNTVTVIDGTTNTTSQIAVAATPVAIAVNPVTNKVYVANGTSDSISIIDGATKSVVTIPVGITAQHLAVNSITNKIYVAGGNTLQVIDGSTLTITTFFPSERTIVNSLVADSASSKIYAADFLNSQIIVIDSVDNAMSTLAASGGPYAMAVNPVTRQVYVGNENSNQLTTFSQDAPQTYPLTNAITPLPNNQTTGAVPAFAFTAASTTPLQPKTLFYQFDTWQGAWTQASGANPAFTSAPATLLPGIHTLYSYAADGQESMSQQTGTPLLGAIQAYTFLVVPSALSAQNINFLAIGSQVVGVPLTLTATASSSLSVTFSSSTLAVCAVNGNMVTFLTPGTCTITASQNGNASYSAAPPVTQTFSVVQSTPVNGAAPSVSYVAFWGVTNSGVTISWSTDVPANSFVAYGTTTALGQLSPVQTALSNSHGAVLTGLNLGTTYYFRAESTNASGSTGVSTIYSFTTTGLYSTPPRLTTNVSVTNIGTTSVTISWITDEAATTQVNYGLTSAYGSSSPLDPSLVTSHSVTLTGLTPGTTYNYVVVSTNASGTGSTGNSTFTTAASVAAPPVISNIQTSVTSNSTTITWTTDQAASSQVNYGNTAAYGSSTPADNTLVTSHSVTISGLSAGTTYNFDVVSGSSANLSTTSPNSTFMTSASNAAPPYVGYVAFWGVTSSGATISWSTDVPASTQLSYGTTAALGQVTPLQPALASSHGIVLTGLNSGTTYYFVAQSTAANGATGYSTVYSFTTGGTPSSPVPAPVLSNLQVTVTPNSATITWTTDEAATSQISYGATANYTLSSTLDPALVTNHSVTLTNLTPGNTYYFEAASNNSQGEGATLPGTFQTSGSAAAPVITNVSSSSITSSTALITWTTDQAASSQVNYGNARLSSASALVTSHSVTLTGLTPNTTYSFTVASANAAGVSSISPGYSFTTASSSGPAPVVSYVAFWGVTSSGVSISWSTDVPANTAVAYGPTASLGQATTAQTALTNSHGVVLTGLQPSTAYYFEAQSADVNGNAGVSTVYSFTTLAGPPSVSGVMVTPGAVNTATISWATSVPAYSYVQYGSSAGNYIRYSAQTSLTTAPQCSLPYVPSGTVHYQLVSTDALGNQYVSPDTVFVEP